MNTPAKNSPLVIGATILVALAALYFGKVLFVPLFFAALISFILYPVCHWLENKGFSRSLAIGVSLTLAILPVGAIVYVLIRQVMEIGSNWTFISQKLHQVTGMLDLPDPQSMNTGERQAWIKQLLNKNSSQLFSGVMGSAASLVQVVIIPFYAALILYHRQRLIRFLQSLFPAEQAERVKAVLHETVFTYYNFVKGMLIVYLVVGVLNSVGLALLGIPNAVIYGFTASILTFIPYVGIMIGSVMPIITAWALHDSIYYPLGVVAIFAFVQFLEANLIFPLAVSARIKVNTLVTLMAIFLGGIIWGATGMILFIPFVAILKLIAEKTDNLRPLADLLDDDNGNREKKKNA